MRWQSLGGASLLASLTCVTFLSCGASNSAEHEPELVRSERVWTDSSRETPATANFAGVPNRTIRALIWQLGVSRRAPLLLMAHGFGGLPEKFDAFARAVAAAGFVVVAPAFPLTNQNAPGGHEVGFADFTNQPGDLTFLITELREAARASGDPLEGRFSVDDVAVLGHSLGGVTVLALTRKACCRDERVRATILASVPWMLASSFGSDPVAANGPPTLIVHGTADPTASFANAPELFELLAPPLFLVGVENAGHSEGLEDQAEPPIRARDVTQRAVVAFLNSIFRNASSEFSAVLAALATEGHVVEAKNE